MAVFRAFLALLAGYAAMATLIGIVTAAWMKLAPEWISAQGQPRAAYVSVNLGYSLVAAILGGYVTAWIARDNILSHTLTLALIVLLFAALSALQQRGKQPIWYQLLLVAMMPVGVMLGGLLRMKIAAA